VRQRKIAEVNIGRLRRVDDKVKRFDCGNLKSEKQKIKSYFKLKMKDKKTLEKVWEVQLTSASCGSTTPLGTPVEPDVYMMMAGSSFSGLTAVQISVEPSVTTSWKP
jgi:hypothetical protein